MLTTRSATRGAVAAGDARTVDAGLHAFGQGGNAVDAAIAALLAATVVEPLLTSFGGGGVAVVRRGADGAVVAHDFFAAVPGLQRAAKSAPLQLPVPVDYGVEQQTFWIGPGAVAVPGMPAGIEDLHERYAALPLSVLAEPALDHARSGIVVASNLVVTAALIEQLLGSDPDVAARYLPGGSLVRAGDRLSHPDLAATLQLLVDGGSEAFYRGELSRALLAVAGGDAGWLTRADLERYRVHRRPVLRRRYRGATLHINPPPAMGGVLLAVALGVLERSGEAIGAMDAAALSRLARCMAAADARRDDEFHRRLDDPAFVAALLNDRALDEAAATDHTAGHPAPMDRGPGSTTHISTADDAGWMVSLTSSNGESAARLWPGTGVMLNNFLGEEDLQSPEPAAPGTRMRTMMTPTLAELPDGSWVALGSGGANRIRSALTQGIVQLVDRGLPVTMAVTQPRIHYEAGVCRAETAGLVEADLAAIEARLGPVVRFDSPHMYFGGLHVVRAHPDGRLDGAGDPRRGGAFGVT